MSVKQTEGKSQHCTKDCLVTMNLPGIVTPLSIRKNTSKAMPHKWATKTAFTIPMMGIAAEILSVLLGNG